MTNQNDERFNPYLPPQPIEENIEEDVPRDELGSQLERAFY